MTAHVFMRKTGLDGMLYVECGWCGRPASDPLHLRPGEVSAEEFASSVPPGTDAAAINHNHAAMLLGMRAQRITVAALEVMPSLLGFDADEQRKIVNVALELVKPDESIQRMTALRETPIRFDDPTHIEDFEKKIAAMQAQSRVVDLRPPGDPMYPPYDGPRLYRHANRNPLASPAAEAAARAQFGDGDGSIPTAPTPWLTPEDLELVRDQCAVYSSDSVWRRLLAAYDQTTAKVREVQLQLVDAGNRADAAEADLLTVREELETLQRINDTNLPPSQPAVERIERLRQQLEEARRIAKVSERESIEHREARSKAEHELNIAKEAAAENGAIFSTVNEALNRAGVYCAVSFGEGIDMVRVARDEARAELHEHRDRVEKLTRDLAKVRVDEKTLVAERKKLIEKHAEDLEKRRARIDELEQWVAKVPRASGVELPTLPVQARAEISPDELAAIIGAGRCARCSHLAVLHQYSGSTETCGMPECKCSDFVAPPMPITERNAVLDTAPVDPFAEARQKYWKVAPPSNIVPAIAPSYQVTTPGPGLSFEITAPDRCVYVCSHGSRCTLHIHSHGYHAFGDACVVGRARHNPGCNNDGCGGCGEAAEIA